MKKKLVTLWKNTFLTTGMSLFLLSIVAFCLGGHAIFIETVWQNILTNACIHITMMLLHRWESPYFLLDTALDILVMTLVVLSLARIFNWFSFVPLYIIIVMILLIYVIGSIFEIFRIKQDIKFINQKLTRRNAKNIHL